MSAPCDQSRAVNTNEAATGNGHRRNDHFIVARKSTSTRPQGQAGQWSAHGRVCEASCEGKQGAPTVAGRTRKWSGEESCLQESGVDF